MRFYFAEMNCTFTERILIPKITSKKIKIEHQQKKQITNRSNPQNTLKGIICDTEIGQIKQGNGN